MFKKLIRFIKESKVELKEKTNWPTKDEVLSSTIVVIVSIVIIAAALWGVDLLFNKLFHFVVVDNSDLFKKYITPINAIATIFGVVIILFIYYKIKKRIKGLR